jgi:phage terminase large subunit-like protein
VLADASGKHQPIEWAKIAIAAYRAHRADRIVAERNNGGAMVEATIRMVDNNVPVTTVWASRGKVTRAEPVSALYEQGRIHHIGTFPSWRTRCARSRQISIGLGRATRQTVSILWCGR